MMRILSVQDYNAQQEEKYRMAIKEWEPTRGGFPYVGFYLFFDTNGNRGLEGFVAYDDVRAIWKPTLIGVKRCYNKAIKKYGGAL